MEQVIALPTLEATRALGRALGRVLQPFDFVALTGDLGAGKTALVKAVAEGAGSEHASSPTFAIVNLYQGGRVVLQHMDLYRLAGPQDLFALGFDDLLAEVAATICEWADRAGPALPADRLDLRLEVTGPDSRQATLVSRGPSADALLARLAAGA